MIVRTAAALAALFAMSPLAAQANPKHDGKWSVEIVTEKGWCDVYRWNIGVTNGRVTDVGAPGAVANGRIDPAGHVSVSLARGSDVMSVSGSVTAAAGAGTWTLPSRSCAGRWRAEKLA